MMELPSSTLERLECSICGAEHSPDEPQTVCRVRGRALFARYDLARAERSLTREALGARPASMWRYAEVMPASELVDTVSLGEGMTTLLQTPRLGAAVGCSALWVKDEGGNPTGSFKARGMRPRWRWRSDWGSPRSGCRPRAMPDPRPRPTGRGVASRRTSRCPGTRRKR